MINRITLKNIDKEIILQSDIAGQNPIYLFYKETEILYTQDLKVLLEYIKNKLVVSNEGISFLLKNGVIPTPYTIYENLYILSIGNKI